MLIRSILLSIMLFSTVVFSADSKSNSNQQMIKITKSGITYIRKERSPDSDAVIEARKGNIFEVVAVGNLLVEVSTSKGNGFVQRANCGEPFEKGSKLDGNSNHTFFFIGIIIFVLAIGGIIMKNKSSGDDEYTI